MPIPGKSLLYPEVIGFYRRADESVLVLFSPGESGEFLTADVEPVA